MKTIHRFTLNHVGETQVRLPVLRQVLNVMWHETTRTCQVYVVYDPEADKVSNVTFRGVMTGEDLEDDFYGKFVSTVVTPEQFVLHFFITEVSDVF